MYSSVGYYICIHSYNHHPDQIKGISSTLEDSSSPFAINTHPQCFDFCHYRLVLHILGHHINRTIQYLLFCVWLLSCNIIFVRLIHVALLVVYPYLLVYRVPLPKYATIYLYLLLLMYLYVISSLGLLWIKLLWMFLYVFW